MPPPSIPADHSRMSNSATSNPYTQLPKVFLLVLVVATCIRITVLYCKWRQRNSHKSYQPLSEEGDSSSCKPSQKEKNPTTYNPDQEAKDSTLCHVPLERDLRQDQWPRNNDQPPPTFQPIYPWISPPQPLPGPYDPRFYPLPTIQQHSYDPSHDTSHDFGSQTTPYARRVSTDNLHATLIGTMTTTSNGKTGWRRNQWVVLG
jgi:hypothetical protein